MALACCHLSEAVQSQQTGHVWDALCVLLKGLFVVPLPIPHSLRRHLSEARPLFRLLSWLLRNKKKQQQQTSATITITTMTTAKKITTTTTLATATTARATTTTPPPTTEQQEQSTHKGFKLTNSSMKWQNPFTPKSDQVQISPCSLTRNITSHSMKNLAFH